MQGQVLHGAQMTVVMAHHLVLLQVPAFHLKDAISFEQNIIAYLFVLARTKQIRMPLRNFHRANRADVAGERKFELARAQLPNLKR